VPVGSFGYYQGMLKPLLQYQDLNTEVLQVFRVVGNTMLLISMFETCVDVVDVIDHQQLELFAKYQVRRCQFVLLFALNILFWS
jgi:hypothetical protein